MVTSEASNIAWLGRMVLRRGLDLRGRSVIQVPVVATVRARAAADNLPIGPALIGFNTRSVLEQIPDFFLHLSMRGVVGFLCIARQLLHNPLACVLGRKRRPAPVVVLSNILCESALYLLEKTNVLAFHTCKSFVA